MAKVNWELFLLFISVINEVWGNMGASPRVNELIITPYKSYKCGGVLDEGIHYTVADISEIDDKFVDIEYTLKEEFNEYWKLRLEVEELINGIWTPGKYDGYGAVCDLLTMYFPEVFKRLKSLSEPSISDECFVSPGTYKVKDFYANKDECDTFPLTEQDTGTFRATVSLFNEFENKMFCYVIEANIKRA